MKTKRTAIIAALAALACAATFAIAQSSTVVRANSPFAGTWEGKLNDLPGIDLKIEEAGGKISGSIVFYFQERPDVNSPWRVTAGYPVPLLAPRIDGKTLTFEAQHHVCHTCAELGPNAKFRVEVAGPDELRLWKLDDPQPGKDLGPGFKLIRRADLAMVHANSPFAGTWEGKLNDLPGIDLKIEEAGGKISGSIVFYFQERPDVNSPWRVTAEYLVPLLSPRIDGKTLTFEAQHHVCHTCAELGPNAKFRVEVAGPDELRLWKLDDPQPSKDLGPGFKLIRRAEPAGSHRPSGQQVHLVSLELRLAVDWGRTPALFHAFRFTLP